jgi:hypothetical protein
VRTVRRRQKKAKGRRQKAEGKRQKAKSVEGAGTAIVVRSIAAG